MEVVPVRTTRATSSSTLTATESPSRSRRKRSMSSTAITTAATDDGDGDSDAGDDYCDYGSPKEEPESKVIDVYHHLLKEEPGAEFGDGDGDTVDVKGCFDFDPPKEEPGLIAADDDADDNNGPDVGHDCSHCGIGLGSRKFKVAHELRCKVQMQRREFESQVTGVYHCCYCRCPFLNEEFKERHQRRYCPKRPDATRMHSDGPYFECDKCEYVTKWKDCLAKHILSHNKENAEWFTCTQCSYKSVHKSSMTSHMKIHSNSFSCCCSICGKSFRAKSNLDDHLVKRHSDESDEVSKLITSKIYTCHICDRFRTTKTNEFNQHLMITHLKGVGSQKYECPHCSYFTFIKGNLKKHSKTHEEQKDYRCTICKKQYAQKMQLDSHILYIHADNVDLMKTITTKIHRCELCSFKTVQKTKLKRHVQSKHI